MNKSEINDFLKKQLEILATAQESAAEEGEYDQLIKLTEEVLKVLRNLYQINQTPTT